ncbi:MAG: hypothetical protein HOA17_05850 [Candidatus Melainabacteria bacterium]|jgi:flagellin-like hook-associated protein FlgL|nr:hypothetical protein [Candidatus Melainabacteria bacterium]
MSNIGRISTLMRFNSQNRNLAMNQLRFAEHSSRLNLQKKHLTNYEVIGGSKELLNNRAMIKRFEAIEKNETKAVAEIGLMSTNLSGLKNILDTIKTSAFRGASDTSSPDELLILGQELRGIAQDFFDGVNTKINGKYIFSGLGSDKKVFDTKEGQIFSAGTYLEGSTYAGNRLIEGKKASIGLDTLFAAQESSANYVGTVPSPATLAANAELNLVVNDGFNEINVGDIALSAGDTVANMVTKINAAFNTAGGVGSIVQNTAGALDFNTSLITGNLENANAAIIVSPGSTLSTTLDELGLTAGTTFGTSTSIQNTFSKLENAYNSQSSQLVRESLVDIQELIDSITLIETELGGIESNFNDAINSHFSIRTDLQIKESELATIPIADAIQRVTAAQAGLNGSMQAAAAVLQASVFNFLSL